VWENPNTAQAAYEGATPPSNPGGLRQSNPAAQQRSILPWKTPDGRIVWDAQEWAESQRGPKTQTQAQQQANRVINTPKGEVNLSVITQEERGAFDRSQRRRMSAAQRVAGIFGVNIEWARGITATENGRTFANNGAYDPNTNTMYLSTDGGSTAQAFMRVAGHEITHSLKGSAAYQILENYVVSQAKANGMYDMQMERLRGQYGEQSQGYLHDELMSDKIGELFENKAELRRFTNAHRGVVGKILNALDRMIERIKGVPEAAAEFQRLRELLSAALDERVAQGGEVRFKYQFR